MAQEARPTLAELAAGSSPTDPRKCPRCECAGPHPVNNTYPCKDGTIHRRRVCRNCQHVWTTYESNAKPANGKSPG